MKRIGLLIGAFAAVALPLSAAEDPIAIRKAVMDSLGAAAGVAGGVMKGEVSYAPAVGKSVIETIRAGAASYGTFFPEGAQDPARSSASPKIWEDRAGFDAKLAELLASSSAATEAAGKAGPPDAATFATMVKPLLDACGSCHETYRIKKE